MIKSYSLKNYRRVLLKVIRALWIIFLSSMTFSGFQGLGAAWGFREDGLFSILGMLSALYVAIVVWNAPKLTKLLTVNDNADDNL